MRQKLTSLRQKLTSFDRSRSRAERIELWIFILSSGIGAVTQLGRSFEVSLFLHDSVLFPMWGLALVGLCYVSIVDIVRRRRTP